ncbi:MAG: carboxypeptidase regulatory-like domain-containing protein, partial [Longimicrobiales bacterium]
MRRLSVVCPPTLALVLSILAATSAVAQQGAVSGRITDASSGQPLPGVQVTLVGKAVGAQTNADGVYLIRGLTPGPVTVRALSIGYGELTQQVTLTAGQTTTANFELRPTPIALPGIVTTVTGVQRRVEVGNAIAQVNATDVVRSRSVSSMADLLTARAAGVTVFAGTQTAAGVRIRIRGTSSLSLPNNPIFVVDGTRVEGTTGASSVSVGGTTAARINDLNPEEIESIEVVRGPSAATLYG